MTGRIRPACHNIHKVFVLRFPICNNDGYTELKGLEIVVTR